MNLSVEELYPSIHAGFFKKIGESLQRMKNTSAYLALSPRKKSKTKKSFGRGFSVDTKQKKVAIPILKANVVFSIKSVTTNVRNDSEPNFCGINYWDWSYHDTGKFVEALDLFKKALAFRETKGEPSSIRVAKWSVARTCRSMKRYDDALKIQLALEEEFSKLPEKDGYVNEELGDLYLVLTKTDFSKKYFGLAYSELSNDEWFKSNEAKRLQRIKELGGK